MKPDPSLVTPDTYPYHVEVPPRYGDMDANAHLNNIAIARYFEEGRVRFQAQVYADRMWSSEGRRQFRVMIAQLRIDYLSEAKYPQPLVCGVGVLKLGNSSYTLASALWQQGACIAVQRCVMVIVGQDGPLPMTQEQRAGMLQRTLRIATG